MSYNGWANYETWNVSIWVDKDESTYRARLSHFRCNEYTSHSAEQFVKEIMPCGTPDFDSPADYEKVDWEEIANGWKEESNG